MGTYDGFIYHRNGAPLMLCIAAWCAIREFLRPEHYPYWKEGK